MLKTTILLLISMTFLGCHSKTDQQPLVCEDFGYRTAVYTYEVYKHDIVDPTRGLVFDKEACVPLEK